MKSLQTEVGSIRGIKKLPKNPDDSLLDDDHSTSVQKLSKLYR